MRDWGCGGDIWAAISSRLVLLMIKEFIQLALAVKAEESLLCVTTPVAVELLVVIELSRL